MNNILVLLASYNGQDFIEDQIMSILNQKQCKVKILVCDDNSSDNTLKILKQIKKNNNNIEIIQNKENVGYSKNFYNLIKLANLKQIDYVAYSDQDDIFKKHKFISSINLLKKYNAVALSSAVECFGKSKKILRQSNNQTKYDFFFEGAGQGCTFVIEANKFKEFQYFVTKNSNLISNFYYHDWLTYLFFRSLCWNWYISKRVLTFYRIHDNNLLGNKNSIQGILFRLKKIFNGWYYFQVIKANNISFKINPKIINLKKISILKVLSILFFHSRRKYIERFLCSSGLWVFIKKLKETKSQ